MGKLKSAHMFYIMKYSITIEMCGSYQRRPLLSRSYGDLSRRGERDLSRRGGERERRRGGGDLDCERRVYGGEAERDLQIKAEILLTNK